MVRARVRANEQPANACMPRTGGLERPFSVLTPTASRATHAARMRTAYSSTRRPGRLKQLQACSLGHAFLVEAWGTALLAFVIFALTDPRNTAIGGGNAKVAVPFMIGALVGVNLSLYAPITQAGWNPARDFGPRIVAAIAGWGDVAIAGPRDGFWVYILAPIVGAVCGGGFYDLVLGRSLGNEDEDEDDEIRSPQRRTVKRTASRDVRV